MQTVLAIETLPDKALEAAAEFAAQWLPTIREHLNRGEELVVMLPHAAYDHADWRRAAVRDLARAHAPTRVNFITAASNAAVAASAEYLAGAGGVTGQYLPLHADG